MKKFILLCLSIIFTVVFPTTVFANNTNEHNMEKNNYIEYFEDGSYIITKIVDGELNSRATGVVKTKNYSYYNSNDDIEWVISISGTFNYNGSTASCTNAVTSYKIYNDRWKVTASSASRSGATARGDFTLKRYLMGIPTKTVDKTVTLTCSKTGVFS